MINRRLIGLVGSTKKLIAGTVLFQWLGLWANLGITAAVCLFLQGLLDGELARTHMIFLAVLFAVSAILRFISTIGASRMSYLSAREVKLTLRRMIYQKLLRLGASYTEDVPIAEVVQMSVEGVDQLESYFGAYLPQFFYAFLAPLTLFAIVGFQSLPSAIVLMVCVPLIPGAIMMVQKIAKRLLSRYWGQYTALGDCFLENLQGLTTLKIYQADQRKHDEMNVEAESFRKVTMKVLTMQLNSITIMDLVAYGGAAVGIAVGVTQFARGAMSPSGCLLIILLSAEFFIPMRQLGSFFHIAMNGMAASDKIFKLLDLPEPETPAGDVRPRDRSILCSDLRFSYDGERRILAGVNFCFPDTGLYGIVGESGAGKSTLAAVLGGKNRGYGGAVTIGGVSLGEIPEAERMRLITYLGHESYLFKGTVRDTLLMGCPAATDEMLWAVLERVKLAAFLREADGLDTALLERGSNLSGGQRQRLALGRALLHDSPIYIFDEATSNIDVESEADILAEILKLAREKTVIFISHRLANVATAKTILVLEDGEIVEAGTHEELLILGGVYSVLWGKQRALERLTQAVQA